MHWIFACRTTRCFIRKSRMRVEVLALKGILQNLMMPSVHIIMVKSNFRVYIKIMRQKIIRQIMKLLLFFREAPEEKKRANSDAGYVGICYRRPFAITSVLSFYLEKVFLSVFSQDAKPEGAFGMVVETRPLRL